MVNGEPDNATELGKENIENLKNLGFDVISLRPNPKVLRTLVKRDFYKYLNPVKVTEYTLWASAYIIAEKFNIPLIIQGQNIGLTVGASNSPLGKGSDALKINECDTLSAGWQDYLEVKDVNEKDLIFYRYDRQRLEKKGIRAIWLQYFMKEWSDRGNAEFSKQYGVKWREEGFDPSSIGTYVPYVQLDSSLHQVNQMLKHIKLGFGECMDHAREVVSVGTSVQWINSGDTESSIQFLPGVTTGLGNDLLQLAPGEMVSTRFDQPGTFGYQCSGENGDLQQAQILAEEAISVRKQREDNILFLEQTKRDLTKK